MGSVMEEGNSYKGFSRKKKPCLRCGKKFMAKSPVNRICPHCSTVVDNHYILPKAQGKDGKSV